MTNKDKHWYRKWWGMLILIVLALLLAFILAVGFYVWQIWQELPAREPSQAYYMDVDAERRQLIEGGDSYSLGTKQPVITIVEFGDFACPYCQQSFKTIRQISTKHFDKVRYIFRDYPVTTEYSLNLALASRCAGDQGLYWPMHDKLFINQGVSEIEDIINLAIQAGVEPVKFSACLKNQDHLPAIRQDIADADQLGVTGTPTWFINNHPLPGYIPHDVFVETVDKILMSLDLNTDITE